MRGEESRREDWIGAKENRTKNQSFAGIDYNKTSFFEKAITYSGTK